MKLPSPAAAAALSSALASVTRTPSSLDLHAYGHLFQHCVENPDLFNVARQLHARLVLHSVTPSNFLASKLLTLYSRLGHLATARKLFDEIPNKNLFAYNAMLIAHSFHSPHPCESLKLFASLPSSLKPDAFTLSSLLKSISCLSSNKEIHGFALRNGFIDSDIFVANGLIAGYARVEDFRNARLLFDLMPERDIVSWNSLISGYSQAGLYDECLRLYYEMEKRLDGVRLDGVTVASVLHACSQTKDLATGMRVHQFAEENGIEMDAVVLNSVIGFYAKCGSLDYARLLFSEMPVRDAVSYNAMITGYMAYGFVDSAMDLFHRMENPVISTWNVVIVGFMQNNRHSDALDAVQSMQDSGFRPSSVTLSSVLPAISFYSNLLAGKQVHCSAIRNDCDQNI